MWYTEYHTGLPVWYDQELLAVHQPVGTFDSMASHETSINSTGIYNYNSIVKKPRMHVKM